jgi:pimeloyl-ACP methyl ester carboxylesterase
MGTDTSGAYRTALCAGRSIAWTEYGDPDGRPFVYYHGAGSSRLEAALLHDAAAAAGLKVIAIDLPGSGQTDPIPGRSILRSVTEDIRMVLSAGDVHRAAIAGMSTGAMYAWAVAAEHPDRVSAVIAISPAVPGDDPAVRAALPARFRVATALARHAPTLFDALEHRRLISLDGPAGQRELIAATRRISRADGRLLADDRTFRQVRAALLEGGRQGGRGREEILLRTAAWDFDPAAVEAPTTVIYGRDDPFAAAIRTWLPAFPGVVARELVGGQCQIGEPAGRAAIIAAVLAAYL